MKYIIKNCPCNVTTEDMCDWENTNETYCQYCTDCLLKQIVEKCKNELQVQNDWWCGAKPLAEEILDLLQIQEVE